jgi:hypothetical protein
MAAVAAFDEILAEIVLAAGDFDDEGIATAGHEML